MNVIIQFLSQYLRRKAAALSVLQTMILGLFIATGLEAIDFLTGFEYSFSIFYLFPVSFVTWYAGRNNGLLLACVCAVEWGMIDVASGARYTTPLIPIWNSIAHLIFLSLTVILLNEMRQAHLTIRRMAFTDSLTGVRNSRSFYLELDQEIERHSRYGRSFTVAYLDLDHFKNVNDTLGHAAGNELLRMVATVLQTTFRDVDIIGRLGGDEFSVILPETDEETAMIVLRRVHAALTAAIRNAAPGVIDIGATIGAVVFPICPQSADTALQLADTLMYDGKRSERGVVRLAVFSESGLVDATRSVRYDT